MQIPCIHKFLDKQMESLCTCAWNSALLTRPLSIRGVPPSISTKGQASQVQLHTYIRGLRKRLKELEHREKEEWEREDESTLTGKSEGVGQGH